MIGQGDLGISFLLAVGIHLGAAAAADLLLCSRESRADALFKQGESSVMLTLMPVEQVSASEDITEATRMDLLQVDPKPDVRSVVHDADLKAKGVRENSDASIDVRPRYPLGAKLRGEEGVVIVCAEIDADGRAGQVTILESSGYGALDRAAVAAMKKVRLQGADLALPTEIVQSIRFQLVD